MLIVGEIFNPEIKLRPQGLATFRTGAKGEFQEAKTSRRGWAAKHSDVGRPKHGQPKRSCLLTYLKVFESILRWKTEFKPVQVPSSKNVKEAEFKVTITFRSGQCKIYCFPNWHESSTDHPDETVAMGQ